MASGPLRQIQRSEVQPYQGAPRLEMTATDMPSGHEFCVFVFFLRGISEGAAHCPDGGKFGRHHEVGELRAHGLRALSAPRKIVFCSDQGGQPWRNTFTGENLALLRKHLAEPHSEAERKILLKLLMDEETKDPSPKEEN